MRQRLKTQVNGQRTQSAGLGMLLLKPQILLTLRVSLRPGVTHNGHISIVLLSRPAGAPGKDQTVWKSTDALQASIPAGCWRSSYTQACYMPSLPVAIRVTIGDHWGEMQGNLTLRFNSNSESSGKAGLGENGGEATSPREQEKNLLGELRVIRAWSWQEDAARQLINI